jgi:hypothetical protein
MKKLGKLRGTVMTPHAKLFARFVQPRLSRAARTVHSQLDFLFPQNRTPELFALALDPRRASELQGAFCEAFRKKPDETLELMEKTRAEFKKLSKARRIQCLITAREELLNQKDVAIVWEVNRAFPEESAVSEKDVENARRKLASRPHAKLKSKAVLS